MGDFFYVVIFYARDECAMTTLLVGRLPVSPRVSAIHSRPQSERVGVE